MKSYKKILLIFISIVIIIFSYSSNFVKAQQVTWDRVLNNNRGLLVKAYETSDNGFIAVGTDRILNRTKIYLQKFSFKGDLLWNKLIGPNTNEHYDGYWIENTFDKGFIICGSGPGPISDGYLVKTDSMGNVQWSNSFGGSDLDQAYCVKQTSDSGYVLILRTYSFTGLQSIWLIKTNSSGEKVWEKVYLANNDQVGKEVIVLNNGYAIVGYAFHDIYLIRTNLSGDTLWTKRYGYSYSDAGISIQQTADKGFIIGGISDDSNNVSKSIIVKTDSSGNLEWQRIYTATFSELLFSVRNIPKKGYIFCGTTDSAFEKLERGFIRIIDFNGNILNEKFYRALPYFTEIRSVERTTDNGFILCGVTQQASGETPKMYIAKTDSIGNTYPVGISYSATEIPNKFNLYQNFPNPFNPTTNIEFSLPEKSFTKLKVFDVTGKEVAELVNENLSAGTFRYEFIGENLPSGVYYYKLETSEFSQTKKMLLIK